MIMYFNNLKEQFEKVVDFFVEDIEYLSFVEVEVGLKDLGINENLVIFMVKEVVENC